MTATVSKAGPYYSSGEIKFSSLRSNFRAQVRKETSGGSETFNTDTAAIKASELLRNTTTTDTSPNTTLWNKFYTTIRSAKKTIINILTILGAILFSKILRN